MNFRKGAIRQGLIPEPENIHILSKQSIVVAESFALPSKYRGIKRKENWSDFGVRTTRGKTNSATHLASGKGTRHCSKVLGSATTGNRTGLKLGLQQFNLQLVDINHTIK